MKNAAHLSSLSDAIRLLNGRPNTETLENFQRAATGALRLLANELKIAPEEREISVAEVIPGGQVNWSGSVCLKTPSFTVQVNHIPNDKQAVLYSRVKGLLQFDDHVAPAAELDDVQKFAVFIRALVAEPIPDMPVNDALTL